MTRGDVKAEDREELEKTGDYIVDEKHKTVTLTESGMAKAEKMLAHRLEPAPTGCTTRQNMKILHHINQALRAQRLADVVEDLHVRGVVQPVGAGSRRCAIIFSALAMPLSVSVTRLVLLVDDVVARSSRAPRDPRP